MGKISRIQLRGISRTPSDRLTEDGGCAESLNVQLDNTELAPSFIPEDVTKKLGLPDVLQAERVFIHKTPNYENAIVVLQDRIVAFSAINKGPINVLENTEKVIDITSVGNTLIISTADNIYYVLYKNREYLFLGNKTPFPHISLTPRYDEAERFSVVMQAGSDSEEYNWNTVVIPEESEWNGPYDNETDEERRKYQVLLKKIWDKVDELKKGFSKNNRLSSIAVVRYAVDILGAKSSSMPIVMSPRYRNALDLNLDATLINGERQFEGDGENSGYTQSFTYWSGSIIASGDLSPYQIFMKLDEDMSKFTNWVDVIESISVYVSIFDGNPSSRTISRITNRQATQNSTREEYVEDWIWKETTTGKSSAVLHLGDRKDDEHYLDDLLAATANTFLVKKIKVFEDNSTSLTKEMKSLLDGQLLDLSDFLDTESEDFIQIQTQERLERDDMKHYIQTSDKLETYNNQLILVQPAQLIGYDYNSLNAYDIFKNPNAEQEVDYITTYEVTYLLRGATEDKVAKAGSFTYKEKVNANSEKVYPFQIFPDSRAYKMIVKATRLKDYDQATPTVTYGEFDMHPHPYLDCAYYYGGFDKALNELCTSGLIEIPVANAVDDLDNKLLISEINDPFSFPLEHRYTFQSKVLGVAVASTALSQGQFGQFPLYVFTEDGIWAMETAADGSFVTSKPLSRDVCVNPKSITSIDNAVVFVSDKGVMLLQGSQVVNISPYMNGKHYVVENTARTIIEGQDFFCDLLPTISDKTHFLAFVKNASVAYDYAGKRLVFIKDDETYQYVYKLDTQTWHKVAYGIKLVAPINSYPECLVMGGTDEEERKFLDVHSFEHSQLDEYQLSEDFMSMFGDAYGLTMEQLVKVFVTLEDLDITDWNDYDLSQMEGYLKMEHVDYDIVVKNIKPTKVYDLSTLLDAQESGVPARGIIATRPFDLGEPDILKTITDIRIRGQFPKGAVKFILLGSNDGINFYTLSTLRGKSWKLFRMIILADLAPTDRISWVDIMYDTKFTNRLR